MPLPLLAWALGALLLGGFATVCWLDDEDKEEIEGYMVKNGYDTLHKVFMILSRVGDRIMRRLGLKGSAQTSTTQTQQREVTNPDELPEDARAAYERIRARRSKREDVDMTSQFMEMTR